MGEMVAYPSYETIEQQLADWAKEHPRFCTPEAVGTTAAGRRIWAVCLTDRETNDEGKEHVLLTACHTGGRERSGATCLLYLMRWLLSGEPEARDILARQMLVCMPVPNPDGYMTAGVHNHNNSHGLNPCNDWTLDGPVNPPKHPEGLAVQAVMDRYQPEVHSDFHGVDLTLPGHMMMESCGPSYSCLNWRPYHLQITRLMEQAAEEAGYSSDMAEEDAEPAFWGQSIDAISHKLWLGRPNPVAGAYCYARYHTLTFTSEVLWAPSALVRHRRLLRVGRDVWPGEYYPGYPTRVVIWQNSDLLTAYGQTAAARRRSRVELWTKLPQLRFGFVNPEMEGLKFNVCTTTSAAAKEWGSNPQTRALAERIRAHPRMNGDYLLKLLARYPDYAGQWGKTANLCLTGGEPADPKESPLEHGLAPRLRIGFPAARITDVRVNGFPVGVSESNGYLTWTACAFTYVQVNIPPEESRRHDVFIITCEYESGVRRVRREW